MQNSTSSQMLLLSFKLRKCEYNDDHEDGNSRRKRVSHPHLVFAYNKFLFSVVALINLFY